MPAAEPREHLADPSQFGEPDADPTWLPGSAEAVIAAFAQHRVVTWFKARHREATDRDISELLGVSHDRANRLLHGKLRMYLADVVRIALSESLDVFEALATGELIPPMLTLDPSGGGPISNRQLVRRTWPPLAADAVATLIAEADRAGRRHLVTSADVRSAIAGAVIEAGVPPAVIDYAGSALTWTLRERSGLRRTRVDIRTVSSARLEVHGEREVARVVAAIVRAATADADELFVVVAADGFAWTRLAQHLDGITTRDRVTIGLRDTRDAGVSEAVLELLDLDLDLAVICRSQDDGIQVLVARIDKPR